MAFRGNRAAVEAIRDGAGAGEIAGAGIDGKNNRRTARVLFGVLGDDLIEADRVVSARLRVIEGRAGQPHVRTGVGIGLRAARVIEIAHEADLLPEGRVGFGGLAEDEVAVGVRGGGEPAPFGNIVLGLRERHAIRGVNGAEAPGDLVCHLSAHGIEHGQGKQGAAGSFQEGTTIEFQAHTVTPFFVDSTTFTFRETSYWWPRTGPCRPSDSHWLSISLRRHAKCTVRCNSGYGPFRKSPDGGARYRLPDRRGLRRGNASDRSRPRL